MSNGNRQTLSYLKNLFAREGIAPRKRFGQNFLIDLNIHEVIVEAAAIEPRDVVLEVGPGAGALTRRIAELGATVVAAEIDPAMARLAARATADMPGVRVVLGDALAAKHRMAPQLMDALRSALAAPPPPAPATANPESETRPESPPATPTPLPRRLKLVANLPYCVATPVITNLLVHPDPLLRPELMVVTIQLELAERMTAAPGTDAYGGLANLVNALAHAEILRVLPPSVFWPRPNVESAIVKITPDPEKRARVGDVAWFQEVARRAFCHRRKNIRRVLHGYHRGTLDKSDVERLLERAGVPPEARAEEMTLDQFLALAQALREALEQAGAPPRTLDNHPDPQERADARADGDRIDDADPDSDSDLDSDDD